MMDRLRPDIMLTDPSLPGHQRFRGQTPYQGAVQQAALAAGGGGMRRELRTARETATTDSRVTNRRPETDRGAPHMGGERVPQVDTTATQGERLLLVFTLGEQRLAVSAERVKEIVRAVALAALPKAPPVIEGVINYRGEVLPVLDIRQRFSFPPTSLRPDQRFIIAFAGARGVVLRVDQVTELLTVPESAIETGVSALPGVEYVSGVARLPDGLIVIHDLERFLSLDEVRQVDAALQQAATTAVAPETGER